VHSEFEIEGVTFRVARLGVDESFAGLELVAQIAGPAFESFSAGGTAAIVSALAGGLGKIPKLLRVFEASAQVEFLAAATGRKAPFVPLNAVRDEVFGGKPELVILFVANCVANEYGNFLGEGLPKVTASFATLFPSLTAPTPGSGG
jgi:hypothetical protein